MRKETKAEIKEASILAESEQWEWRYNKVSEEQVKRREDSVNEGIMKANGGKEEKESESTGERKKRKTIHSYPPHAKYADTF